MLSYLLILMMVLLYTFQSVFCKQYAKYYPGDPRHATPVFTIVGGIVVAVVSFFFSGMTFSASPLTLLLGVANAITLYCYNYSVIQCTRNGSYSVLMVFSVAGGIILPAIFARIVFGDDLSLLGILFILLIIASVYMVSSKSGASKITRKFLMYCFLLAFFNGVYGILLDVQQRLTGVEEKEEMVTATFLMAAIFSLVTLLFRRANIPAAMKQTKISFVYLMAYAIVAALAVNLLVLIIPLVNVTILYTMDNAGVMLLSVLCSCIFYKEKLSPLNIVGCILMAFGLAGMALFA